MNNKNSNTPDRSLILLGLKTVIRTKDFEASKKFYTELLGLGIIEEYDSENGSRGCILGFAGEDNNAFIEISEIRATHNYYQPAFSKMVDNDKMDIQIRTQSADHWAKKLKGIWKTRGPIERPWGSRYLYLRDPDGVNIIIYEEKKE